MMKREYQTVELINKSKDERASRGKNGYKILRAKRCVDGSA